MTKFFSLGSVAVLTALVAISIAIALVIYISAHVKFDFNFPDYSLG